jgi:hypothetical protein
MVSQRDCEDDIGADGARSIGTYNWDTVVELEYPEVFQTALLKVLDAKKTFKYIYLGGAFTETDQEKKLWFYSEGRRVRVRFCLSSCDCLPLFCVGILTLPRDLPRRNYKSLETAPQM